MSKANIAVAGKKDVILLPVADLKMKFDVRKSLNEDRVLLFMELYESENSVPPIEVVHGTMEIHDGRHRKAALDYLGRKHAECVLVEPMEFVDQLMDAFAKNVSDSPFPPTRSDITFVMKQLLEAGTSNAQVQKRFEAFYKPSHVRKLLKDAHANLINAKMARAKQAVAHGGMTVKEAAVEHGVEPERLQDEITGLKKRRKATSTGDIKVEISNRHRGNSAHNIAVFRDLLDKFEDGEISEKSVLEVLLHVQRLNTDAAKRVSSWIERFESLKGSMKAKS
jgi:hypothetical protein